MTPIHLDRSSDPLGPGLGLIVVASSGAMGEGGNQEHPQPGQQSGGVGSMHGAEEEAWLHLSICEYQSLLVAEVGSAHRGTGGPPVAAICVGEPGWSLSLIG